MPKQTSATKSLKNKESHTRKRAKSIEKSMKPIRRKLKSMRKKRDYLHNTAKKTRKRRLKIQKRQELKMEQVVCNKKEQCPDRYCEHYTKHNLQDGCRELLCDTINEVVKCEIPK